jgi:hypothetical protein
MNIFKLHRIHIHFQRMLGCTGDRVMQEQLMGRKAGESRLYNSFLTQKMKQRPVSWVCSSPDSLKYKPKQKNIKE